MQSWNKIVRLLKLYLNATNDVKTLEPGFLHNALCNWYVRDVHTVTDIGRLDLIHLINLNKMKFLNNVSTSPIRVLQCCISQAMRSASVKKLFYYYAVYTSCCHAVSVLILFLVK